MKRVRTTARPIACLLLPLVAGCYVYVPASLEAVPEGARVRVWVRPAAEEQLRATFGLPNSQRLEGELVSRSGDQVTLFVPSVPLGTAYGNRPLYQRVPVAAADILRVDLRRLDRFRTGAAVAIAALAALVVAREAFSGAAENLTPPGGEPPPESVRGWTIPLAVPRP